MSVGTGSYDRGQHLGDVLIGEAMKAVAFDTKSRYGTRQGKGLGDGWLPLVESGIETGYLWESGHIPGNRPDRRRG